FEYLIVQVARRGPFWLGDVGVRLAVTANDTVGPDQDGRVEVDAILVDLRHADDDVAALLARERGKPVGGRPRNPLDKGRDFGAVEPAIARCSHFRCDDELGTGSRRLLAEFEQAHDVALLLEHGRLELDGGDLVDGGHGPASFNRDRTSLWGGRVGILDWPYWRDG